MAAPLLGEPLPVELLNTIWADRDGVHDALEAARGAVAWLDAVGDRLPPAAGLLPGGLSGAALREVRAALLCLAVGATGDHRAPTTSLGPPAAMVVLNRAAACGTAWPELVDHPAGPRRELHCSATLEEYAAGVIAREAVDLFGGHDRDRLGRCHAPGCTLFFLRTNPRRAWCSAACGNRARVARHHRRHGGQGVP